jgi:eukaryotic-like serine/threonine-protein kinase
MSPESSTKGPQRSVQIGKYKVLLHLATGGMGAVYKAYDTEAKREVALKVLTPEMAAKPIMIERFRREARHAGKLRHENIVELYEFGEANGRFFIAMEFVEGLDLHEYIARKGLLEPESALKIITQAAKALDHAHRQGIVHRDVKPSNFLVTRLKGRLVVKMTDLGLSRETNTEEFRVTRAGTTVGTVDYISPEQARDSGTADIRSDLYSLGCTWFHLLAGKAPFSEGGLAERLHKHLNIEPPDVRLMNPRATKAAAAVLRRLLAKRPVDRYQTPADLLKDLGALKNGGAPTGYRAVALGLLDEEGQNSSCAQTAELPSAKTKAERSGSRRSASDKGKPSDPQRRRAASRARLWYILGGAIAAGLAAIVVALAFLPRRPHASPLNADLKAQNISLFPGTSVDDGALNPVAIGVEPPDKTLNNLQRKTHWPMLDPSAPPVDAVALRKEINAGWTGLLDRPSDAPVFHVARAASAGAGPVYPTLAAAAAAAPTERFSVIEIDDDGPLFETSTTFSDRQLLVCAGKGFRPVVVWDVPRTLDERRLRDHGKTDNGRPPAFLTVERGGLRLENLDVAFKQPEAVAGGLTLLDVQDGDLSVEGCTFSLAGSPREETVLTKFHATRPAPVRCQWTRSFVRGPAVTALDIDAPGAAVLIDHCLMVGGEPALIQVRANDALPTMLTVVGSTLICGRTLLNVRQKAPTDHQPAVRWRSWDSLLTRSSVQPGGVLVAAPGAEGANDTGIHWQATNCLYAGWQNLLTGPKTIAGTDRNGWLAHWQRANGDTAIADSWPAFNEDTSALPASTYHTAETPVGFAATAAPDQPLGCDLNALPPTRENEAAMAFDGFVRPPLEPITDGAAPEVPPADDNLYHGGALDITLLEQNPQQDLGSYLRDLQQRKLLAPRVVLLLSGAGEHRITPFHLKGCTLVLYAEPPRENAVPLTFQWNGEKSVDQEGLIEIDNGGLDLINIGVKLADFPRAATPAYILKAHGDLRLFRCRLDGPQQNVSDAYRGLIDLQGSGDPAPNAATSCSINESVLVSGRDGVQIRGVGTRLLLRQSLLVAAGDALHLVSGPNSSGRANQQCMLEQSTIAVRRSVIHLEDAVEATDAPPKEPLVVRSRACAFLNPFAIKSGQPAGMVVFEKSALAHGLLVWQGDTDALSRRLTFAAAPSSSLPDKDEGRAAWTRLWGSTGDRRPADDVKPTKPFDAVPWALDRLALPKTSSPDKRIGADLALLRIGKKQK